MNRGRKRGRIQGPRVTQGSTFSLTRMLHPVKRAHFVQHYWEKQPLRIRRNDPDYYSDLLTLADVDRILSATGSGLLRSESFGMAKRFRPARLAPPLFLEATL